MIDRLNAVLLHSIFARRQPCLDAVHAGTGPGRAGRNIRSQSVTPSRDAERCIMQPQVHATSSRTQAPVPCASRLLKAGTRVFIIAYAVEARDVSLIHGPIAIQIEHDAPFEVIALIGGHRRGQRVAQRHLAR